MTAAEIRQQFFDFFEGKGHKIVPSAPMVNKDDPSLMFTNAGMNQFKDYFLGNRVPEITRIADTQKCLRVSGKHNDLEEVGIDSYHHTMFEMLGNWSFGDYFKKEAISWAWELLTEKYGLSPDRLYASVFKGDVEDGLPPDEDAADLWKVFLPADRILYFDRKDNFWEMGDTGPCGPCSEIHIDLRSDAERLRVDGRELVNNDHPLVIEIWNLVFIQFNRKSDGSLETLPDQHVDTGMGFERLTMAIQSKTSNYDTDIFVRFIKLIEKLTGQEYQYSYALTAKKDIAFRVIADHIRAVAFAIADGQLPSNTGAGYVIRRILRRAVRYYFSFLDRKEPLMHALIPALGEYFKDVFPELHEQEGFVAKIIFEEEKSFLRTLDAGLKRLSLVTITDGLLDGKTAFELYDTYGFPIDLTRLIGAEQGWKVDETTFISALSDQKTRSRADAKREAGDWIENDHSRASDFIGYDHVQSSDSQIVKYRELKQKDNTIYQLVLDKTPFYAESGGQVGDTGVLIIGEQTIKVLNTTKENDLIIHQIDTLPLDINAVVRCQIDKQRRVLIEGNHTATHLLHAALRDVLGDHVQQKGSLVNEQYLRFDFSHFEKMTDEQILRVENIVNERIRQNITKVEQRNVPISRAKESGAMMLFGEKYGEFVRMITFDPSYSVELCGGCHVRSTGEIGLFKIRSESAIAAGVRRIEAVTGVEANEFVRSLLEELQSIKSLFKSPVNTRSQVEALQLSNKDLEKELTQFKQEKIKLLKSDILGRVEKFNQISFVGEILESIEMDSIKELAHHISQSISNGVVVLGVKHDDKANIVLLIDKDIVSETLDAAKLIRKYSALINGGGGGQAFLATAGGKNTEGLTKFVQAIKEEIMKA